MTIDEMNERKRELGYTDMRISEISGVPLSTVRKVLGGATKAPRYETIRALTKALEKPSKSPASPYPVVREAQPAYGSKKQGEYTLEDYLAIPDERRVELIDGVIYDMSSPRFMRTFLLISPKMVVHVSPSSLRSMSSSTVMIRQSSSPMS